MRRWNLRPSILVAAVLALVPLPALASGTVRLVSYPQGRVVAGDMVEIGWTDVGSGADEVELLLSLDGGRRFPIRISPELDPLEGRIRWRVPNLPTTSASIRLRFGRAGAEIATAPSPCFEIAGVPGARPEPWGFHEGCDWDGPDAGTNGPPPPGMAGSPPVIAMLRVPPEGDEQEQGFIDHPDLADGGTVESLPVPRASRRSAVVASRLVSRRE